MPISFSGSEIVALCLESVLYGVFVALFVRCLRILLVKSNLNVRLVLVSGSLFVLITWHETLDAFRLVKAFRTSQTTTGGDAYFAEFTSPLSVMKTTVYVAETIVSDLFILYRSFVVWDKRVSLAAFPFLVFLADLGTGIGSIYELAKSKPDPAFNKPQERITNAFFSCTLGLNAMCTGLIAFRIWWTQGRNKAFNVKSSLTKATIIMVESGVVYVVSLVILVATYSAESLVFNIFLDVLSPIIGIVFLLIIVRVGLGISSDADTRVAAESSMDVSATPKRSHHHAARCTDTDPSSAWTSVPVSSGVHLDTMDDIVLSSISGNSGPLRSQGSYETDMWKVDDRSEGFPGDAV